jgi:hypothetical protein
MARTLFCGRCDAGYLSTAGDVPRQCPFCQAFTVWRTMAPIQDEPRQAWELNRNDCRFLKSIKIASET